MAEARAKQAGEIDGIHCKPLMGQSFGPRKFRDIEQ
jgi:hypothetical protein